jgi:hypothetical protein
MFAAAPHVEPCLLPYYSGVLGLAVSAYLAELCLGKEKRR